MLSGVSAPGRAMWKDATRHLLLKRCPTAELLAHGIGQVWPARGKQGPMAFSMLQPKFSIQPM